MLFNNLTEEQLEMLRQMVAGWVEEGFTTPPYRPAAYDIFEALGFDPDDWWQYDIRRPVELAKLS